MVNGDWRKEKKVLTSSASVQAILNHIVLIRQSKIKKSQYIE